MANPQACGRGNPFAAAVSFLIVAASAGLAAGCDDNSAPAGHTEADDGNNTSDSALDAQATIPDLHADPDELEGGARLCAILRNACHPFDKGAGDLADRCHDWGHEGAADVCAEHYDDCMALCSQVDAGRVTDASAHDASSHPHTHHGDAAGNGHRLTPIELVDHDTLPSVELTLNRDSVSGWNLHAALENFNLAPERASSEHVFGEGHMHLFVDNIKHSRVYSPWFHLPELPSGQHEVRLELTANSHNVLTHHGDFIGDTTTITQAASDAGTDASMNDSELIAIDADVAPSVNLRVHEDIVAGWNVELTVTDFAFAPELVSTAHVRGQGYARLYVDGVYRARLYGKWFHISELGYGVRTLSVKLSTNDHRTYAIGDAPIEAVTELEVRVEPTASSVDAGAAHDASQAAP